MSRIFFLISFSFFLFHAFSQANLSTKNAKAKQLYLKSYEQLKSRDFEAAIHLLDKAIQKDTTFYEAYARLSNIYYKLGQLDAAFTNYVHYVHENPNPEPNSYLKLSKLAFNRGKYHLAKKSIENYKKNNMKPSKEVDLVSNSIIFSLAEVKKNNTIEVWELPEQINRFQFQYLPATTVDNHILIFTKRDYIGDDEDIAISYFRDAQWTPAQSISSKINTSDNEGACTISADGKTLIFASCNRKDTQGSCDLYETHRLGNIWSRPTNLGKPVNTQYWESQPSLSADGRKLFFASNRPGGKGGRDIWVTKKINNTWIKPINLPGNVNTAMTETTPYIHTNGYTLFFASNGHVGMGNFDLFRSTLIASEWVEVTNLGYPINTYQDELALMLTSHGNTAYFSKETKKNQQVVSSKLVGFHLPKPLTVDRVAYLTGQVRNKKSHLPLKAEIEVIDVNTNSILYNNFSDSLSGQFLAILPIKGTLALYVKKKGFLYHDFQWVYDTTSNTLPDTLFIELEPIEVGQKMILQNIYFALNSHHLDEHSLGEIEHMIEVMNQNPKINIEISGHTDDTGTKAYNQKLSEKRANAVIQELIKLGILSHRLIQKGYGDTMPLKPNTSEENRKINRRIEFKIVSI